MALYELKEATLDGLSGHGYAFPVSTFRGIEYRGVFFPAKRAAAPPADAETAPDAPADAPTDTAPADAPAPLEALVEADAAEFTGTVYKRTSVAVETVPVNVTEVVTVAVGDRADFEVLA